MKSDFEQYDDVELFYLMKSGSGHSEEAFRILYNRYSARIYSYCRKFLGNKEEARDVFQEAFVRFYQSAQEEREMTNVPAFLLKIARNLCVNLKRKDTSALTFEDYMSSTYERSDNDELLNLIKTGMELLPPEYKELFILREYEGLTYNEIVNVTGLPLATVKIRLFRARQKLREILAPYLADLSKY
ncbi:MAG: RNA polymerase sigma factor [Candidatus Kapabacteria bacterium]|nr:RNA polymerase sigma factor [Candidatus Kapabacteria bacterium]